MGYKEILEYQASNYSSFNSSFILKIGVDGSSGQAGDPGIPGTEGKKGKPGKRGSIGPKGDMGGVGPIGSPGICQCIEVCCTGYTVEIILVIECYKIYSIYKFYVVRKIDVILLHVRRNYAKP